ncbi:DEAD/DEAH box helicase [Streptomyces sp. SID13666]|uniref:DEAD/DEAH box helicase n=1 Tax=unclassified Streptomyces TaxID=2593676 RepID=UPI0013C0BF46|nr:MULTISPECIES: DEAD/DEAH box helicase [unclassified Streptomyces]NEA55749.1 DEAD/DEAH box helicase [Streptomyces sp. SID13666]NEA71215.1 DEAD/DEAH box helicase [Streptomyces sp. SID13588]
MTDEMSPAERYAADRRRAADQATALAPFRALYDFDLDPFQIAACQALEAGSGVLVAAPTGSGKTIVGEFAVHLALTEGRKCFYTTPIKALSNQKFSDLVKRYGADKVGLLTGDNSVNGDAPVVVMTTEVLRNMLYAGSSALDGLGYVVMDEVHYLSDRFRGAVWEEVIIHLPQSVTLVSLSATVSNAEEFGDWLDTVRGSTEVIVSEHRPVPLWQHVLAGRRMYDLFEEKEGAAEAARREVNPDLVRLARMENQRTVHPRDRHKRGYEADRERERRSSGKVWTPSRADVIDRLDSEGLLPAITFIFSRAGCEAAVQQCLYAGLRLNSDENRERVRAIVQERTKAIPDEDLHVLKYFEWLEGLERGVAAHHAGMLPTFKEVVEELFLKGLVKAVFATETLALGINMPARSVVLEKLVKWNGETHADITPGEYTQLTGRAGRRGIDVEGHAVVLWQRGFDPGAVAGLAGTRTYPLRSSFKPSYNMAVNLVGQFGRHRSRELLETSFAQFQADRSVVGISKQVQRNEEGLDGYKESMTCHLGNFDDYMRLRRQLKEREAELSRQGATQRRAAASDALEKLKPGDIIHVPAGKYAGLALVLEPGVPAGRSPGHRRHEDHQDGPRPLVLTAERQVKRLAQIDFPVPVEAVDRMRIPKSFNPRSPQSRRDLASAMRTKAGHYEPERHRKSRAAAADDTEIARMRTEIRAHPCHGCDEREDHARWAERYHRLARDTKQLERRIEGRTNTIARTFDRICGLLTELGYLQGEQVTADGKRLARLYGELDLLASECLREGVWDGLGPAELAACVSALVFEARQSDDALAPKLPTGNAKEALAEMVRIWGRLDALEEDHRIHQTEGVGQREPDLGFAWPVYRWASGHGLDAVLGDAEMPAGDFVRWCKQVIDVLGQISDAAPTDSPVRKNARKAVDALRRGVVAYSSVG